MSPLMIIALLVLLLVLWVLFLRIRLIIDTEQDRYELRLRPLARAELIVEDERIAYGYSLLFYKKQGELFPDWEVPEIESPDTDDQEIEKEGGRNRKNKRSISIRQALELGRSLLSSFKVNRFRLLLNTEDAIANAWLYPVFTFWRSRGQDVELRFFGRSELVLDIENALHRVFGALFYNYLIKPLKSWIPT